MLYPRVWLIGKQYYQGWQDSNNPILPYFSHHQANAVPYSVASEGKLSAILDSTQIEHVYPLYNSRALLMKFQYLIARPAAEMHMLTTLTENFQLETVWNMNILTMAYLILNGEQLWEVIEPELVLII